MMISRMLAILTVALAADAQTVERPTTVVPSEGCVTEACHANVKQHKAIHGPVNVNACDACHALTSASKHTFQLTRKPEELCTFCHVVETEGAKVVHAPLQTGQCTGCHDPHGGFDRSFLKAKSMNELCKTCHQDVIGNRTSVHGPVAAGACGACHAPHTSEHPKLLFAEGRALCVTCHQEMDQQLAEVKVVHEPVKGDCTQCHDAHASNHAMMVRAAPADLCTSCHQDVRHAVTEAKFQHSAVMQDQGCANCHTAHGGDLAGLLSQKPIDLCLTCHQERITTPEGTTVASVSEIADPALNKHGPVADGTCGGCHNVHGSDVSRLLAKPYPATFYESFELEKYALCFTCHDEQLVLLPRTRGLTGFRDGDLNLHYLHVNKDKRGRSCRACHTTHASEHPVHIRDSVPYGQWQLPINYTPTETGGTCAPGCHQELSYDREKAEAGPRPAVPTAAAEATAAPAPATAEETTP